MDYSEYEKILRKEVSDTWIFWVILVVLVGMFIYINKSDFYDDMKKWAKIVSNIIIVVVIISTSLYFATYIYNSYSDINNEAYVVYEGEFYINDHRGDYVHIEENGKKRTLSYYDANYMEGGTYTGKFVYAKRTGIILEMQEYSKK